MGRLFCTETGRVLVAENEEITCWRWARKALTLPRQVVAARADLWLYLASYDGNRTPLSIELNGKALTRIKPDDRCRRIWQWRRVAVPVGRLRSGLNQVVLRSDNPAMNAWMLGLETGHRTPASQVSTDRGGSWRRSAMGARNMLNGEYLIRLRCLAKELDEPRPPRVVYEDPRHPRVQELARMLPVSIRQTQDPWKQVRLLRTWVARSWGHDPFGANYAPWDPWTVIDWARRKWGHGQEGAITMCVHFGAVFTALASALGHRARCIAYTTDVNGMSGHFLAEVWDPRRGRWILHDANYDVHYEVDGQPLSAVELADRAHRGLNLRGLSVAGPGMPTSPPRVTRFFRHSALRGDGYRNTAVWLRNNFISDPTAAPPSHGHYAYSETDFLWYNPAGMDLMPMFPYRSGDRRVFERSPAGRASF